ncbi:carbonic anhydrase [Microcoleus asticus]|uniref:Carbonic anhydrase n=1 Tax=Microcoleus asticus IPMA8 TaxID=2563858 RepID=A0ABX2CRA7_9CYAN|nr:carbonic anhydrase family protein [Microcoleus asticus]NQE32939.1 Carbonic anhydrase [Microcoleus asticus IPMA8]
MDRRTLLKLFGFGALEISFGVSFPSRVSAVGQEADWGYIGESGVEKWGNLSPEFQVCKTGIQQSPIDLHRAIAAQLSPIEIDYRESPLRIVNNGHTIQVNYEPGSSIKLDGQIFNLVQFHFHDPSEHTIDNKPFDMELHLVHRSEAGALAVIGVLLKQGQHNAALQPIGDAFPNRNEPEQVVKTVKVNAEQFLPKDRKVYRYFSSLTTPPCSQGVNWIVMQQPIEISQNQIQRFPKLISIDARPVQPLNNSFVLRSS